MLDFHVQLLSAEPQSSFSFYWSRHRANGFRSATQTVAGCRASNAPYTARVLAYGRILAPIDFSECSEAALEHAVFLAERLGADLDLMHVLEGDDDPLPYWFVPGEAMAGPAEAFRNTHGGQQLMALVSLGASRRPSFANLLVQF
jgi:Universal stress protein family